MSDMNLPTVTVENDGTTVGPFYVTEDEVHEIVSYEEPGTYALVPVDAMEKVWWCEATRESFTGYTAELERCPNMFLVEPDHHQKCGWLWLLSPKEEVTEDAKIAHRYWNQSMRFAVQEHPALAGMLCHLPYSGESWTEDERQRWVETFLTVLDTFVAVEPLVSAKEEG